MLYLFSSLEENLQMLKQSVRSALPAENLHEYSVQWSDEGGVNAQLHGDYLQQFCQDFYEGIKLLIDRGAASQSQFAKVSNI